MNFSEIIFNKGRVYLNPVNLTTNLGTELCFIDSGVNFLPGYVHLPVSREEDGAEIWKIVYIQGKPILTFVALNYNAEILKLMFLKSSLSLTTGAPGSLKSGQVISDDSNITCRLLFLPDDMDNNPCLIIQKALVVPINKVNIRLSHKDKMSFPISCYMLRKDSSTYGIWYYGLLKDGVLV
jgi:hypothetical protein